jgi:hypothetical protein
MVPDHAAVSKPEYGSMYACRCGRPMQRGQSVGEGAMKGVFVMVVMDARGRADALPDLPRTLARRP